MSMGVWQSENRWQLFIFHSSYIYFGFLNSLNHYRPFQQVKPQFYPVFITVYRQIHYRGTSHVVWWWSAVWWDGQNDFIQGADILYEHAPFQEVPRSFQMIGVDTELCR